MCLSGHCNNREVIHPLPLPILSPCPGFRPPVCFPPFKFSFGLATTKSNHPQILPHINCFDAGRESGAYGHLEMLCQNQHQCLISGPLAISHLALPILPVTVGADDHEANEADETAPADADVSRPNDNTNPDNPNSCYTAPFGVLPFPLRQLVSPPSFHFPLPILVRSRSMKPPRGSAI
jgi:hypothetical protein